MVCYGVAKFNPGLMAEKSILVIGLLLYLVLYVEYRPAGRACHISEIVGNKLYIHSGWQKNFPQVHDSEAKQRYNSRIEILDLISGNWRQYPTTGNPPLGFLGCASAVVDNNIIFFGGFCGHEGCYHNSVTSLCADTLNWKELFPTNPNAGPMMKSYCKMIPVKIDGKNYLFVIGGNGSLINTPRQVNAQYSETSDGFVHTNEQHYFNLSTCKYRSIKYHYTCSVSHVRYSSY